MTVTKRIEMIKTLVPKGARVLDVGSDHALLPISLFLDGVITEAVISDINVGPLNSGKSNVARLAPGLKASFVLSDGFKNVEKGGYDVAAVCGMGGELIAAIIDEAEDKAHVPLILQPMSHAERLREYLWSNGFEIKEECFAAEGKRAYLIISAVYTGKSTKYDYDDLFYGQFRPDNDAFALYSAGVAKAAKKRLEGYKLQGDEAMAALTENLILLNGKK